ncbi:MAG: hypothetical protein ACT4QF_00005 [Sporichthyaceae bacterium]|jgi:hypothetical protein
MATSDVHERTDRNASSRTWYGRRRKQAARKPTPKGGYDRYRGYDAPEEQKVVRTGVDLSITAFGLGLTAILLAWWPWLKYVGVFLALGAIVMATRELSRHDPEARIMMRGAAAHAERFARTGRTLALVALVVVVGNGLWGMKTARDDEIKARGGATAGVLQDLNVRFDPFVVDFNGVGQPIRYLRMTVQNKTDDTCLYEVQTEALAASGERIASEQLVEPSMRPGETRERRLFQFVDEPTTEALKTATFRVATATKRC